MKGQTGFDGFCLVCLSVFWAKIFTPNAGKLNHNAAFMKIAQGSKIDRSKAAGNG
jgi:hypothetical protein